MGATETSLVTLGPGRRLGSGTNTGAGQQWEEPTRRGKHVMTQGPKQRTGGAGRVIPRKGNARVPRGQCDARLCRPLCWVALGKLLNLSGASALPPAKWGSRQPCCLTVRAGGRVEWSQEAANTNVTVTEDGASLRGGAGAGRRGVHQGSAQWRNGA